MTLEILAQINSFIITTIGDLNANSTNWYNKDKTSFEGDTIKNITLQLGLHHLIKDPTHILQNSSLCIDQTFIS